MEAFLVLCDAANVDPTTGKVNMLGGGWSVTGPGASAAAVAGFLRMPWEGLGGAIRFALRLVDDAGQAVCPFVDSDKPLRFDGEFALPDLAVPDDAPKHVPLNIGFAIPLPPLPLTPGRAYRWVLEAGDREAASVDFAVRPEKD